MPLAASARPERARISPRAFWLLVTCLFLIAAAVRLFAWNKWFRHLPLALDDNYFYHWQAKLLADGHGFINPFYLRRSGISVPSAGHPPLFTTVLAIPSLVGLGSVEAHRIFACLVGASVVVPIAIAGRRLGGAFGGLVAAAIAAVFPALWMNDGLLLSETVAAVAVAWVIVAAMKIALPDHEREAAAADGSAPWRVPRQLLISFVVLGLVSGLAALARSELVLLGPLMIAPLGLLRGTGWRQKIALVAAGGVAMALLIAPWVVRNSVSFERPTTLSTGAGFVLDIANCDSTYSGKMFGYWSPECAKTEWPKSTDESVIEASLRADGLAYIKAHKSGFARTALARVGRVFHLYRIEQSASFDSFFERRPKAGVDLGIAMFYGVAAMSSLGIALLAVRRRGSVLVVLLAPLAITLISTATGIGITRYRVAADVAMIVTASLFGPALVALATWGSPLINSVFDRLGRPRPRKSTVAIAVAALGALAIRWFVILGTWQTCAQGKNAAPLRSPGCFAIWGDALYSHLQGVRIGHGQFYLNPFLWAFEPSVVAPSAGDPPLYAGLLGAVTWFGSVLPNWVSFPVSVAIVVGTYFGAQRLGAVRRFESASARVATAAAAAAWVALPLLVISVGGGEAGAVHRLVSAWFGATAVGFIGLAARRIAGPWAGVIAAVIAAVHPLLWVNDVMLMSETPYVCFLAIAMWAAYRYWRTPTMAWACTVSLFVGLAAVTRAESSLLFGLLVLPLVARGKGLTIATKVRQLAAGAAIAVLLIGPWLVFNTVRFREGNLTTMTTGTGAVLGSASCDQTYYGDSMGYWATCISEPFTTTADGSKTLGAYVDQLLETDKYTGRVVALCGAKSGGKYATDAAATPPAGALIEVVMPRRPSADPACHPTMSWDQVLDESESDGIIRDMAGQYIDHHKSRLPTVAAVRVLRMFSIYRPMQTWQWDYQIEGRGKWSSGIGMFMWWGMAIPAFGALVWMWRRKIPVSPLVSPFIAIAATAALTFGINRYRVPADVAEVILFGVACGALIGYVKSKRAAREETRNE